MKYCIYKDQPMSSLTISGEPILLGCTIFGVHHDCEGCPNLVETGETNYTYTNE